MARNLVCSGTFDQLKQITKFCRDVYHVTFGPVEGERRFLLLTVVDAVALWVTAQPDPSSTT